ncbi:MAG: folate-binding protein [Pegethrix bostrychoides GSE-TBD4-15B]|jgi:hypothetical protein|uniref:Folate-binding protein n=1 Tax=Pegethrix bostrychoides GSE-TBD4-15B TaxID=2839662 RepID=A0A951P8I4_9CYAN|nr:folate-binding protein [Pegethrix bostrychoides GSE-TBD4-15B]
MELLRAQQITAGATLSEAGIPLSFGNEAAALTAARDGVALYDRSHWGRISVTGDDRIRFLHNQSTNDFNILKPGQGCETVFVTSTARSLDLVTAYLLEDSVLLLTSPGYGQRLIDWMDRFIFFADRVELKNLTDATVAFSLLGSQSDTLLQQLGAASILGQSANCHQLFTLNGIETRISVGSGLTTPGYTLFVAAEQAADLWQQLIDLAAVPLGETLWQQLRIQQGRPFPGQELTDDYNPLEAGLWQTISLSKGCYIGQETIVRLHTYKGVKQQLWGLRLASFAEPESPVMLDDEKIGRVTSCMQTTEGYLGLAYIKTKSVESGLEVQVAGEPAKLVPLSFVSHAYI